MIILVAFFFAFISIILYIFWKSEPIRRLNRLLHQERTYFGKNNYPCNNILLKGILTHIRKVCDQKKYFEDHKTDFEDLLATISLQNQAISQWVNVFRPVIFSMWLILPFWGYNIYLQFFIEISTKFIVYGTLEIFSNY